MQDFASQLGSLRDRLDVVHAADGDPTRIDSAMLVSDLEVAYEELRVAEEELRTQHDEISRLVEGHDLMRRQHERTLAMLPVPAIVTDGAGLVRTVNSAAAVMCRSRVARIIGKPIFSLFDPDDRRLLRSVLSRSGELVDVVRHHATVRPREGKPVPVEVSVTLQAHAGGVSASWIFLAASNAETDLSEPGLAQALSALTAIPAGTTDLQHVLADAAAICLRSLGAGFELSVNVGSPQAPTALSTTSLVAQAVDGAQMRLGEGPCVTAFEQRTPVHSAELATDSRWPRLQRLVPDEVTGCVAAPIEIADRLVGALNVYGVGGEVTSSVVQSAELLGATLGAVLYELELAEELARLNTDMERALSSRSTIEQAKGIIMGQRRCTADEAFAHLTAVSSAQERKLRDVALSIVESAARS